MWLWNVKFFSADVFEYKNVYIFYMSIISLSQPVVNTAKADSILYFDKKQFIFSSRYNDYFFRLFLSPLMFSFFLLIDSE